jgi:acyl-CoA hydrolase
MRLCREVEILERLRTLEVREPRIVVSGNFATPWALVHLADQALETFRLFALNPQEGFPQRDGVVLESPFLGPAGRNGPHVEYIPMRLSLAPRLFSSTRPPDAVFIHTSTPRNGKVSLGLEVNILPAAIEEARRRGAPVIAQINAHVPYTYGDSEIDVEHIDVALAFDTPLPSPSEREADEASNAIGERIAGLASDGTTLQMGIGMLPDAALSHLKNRRNLGVWTEMLSDGVMALDRAGCLDERRPIVASFLFGSPELYEWLDENPRLVMRRTEVTNDPGLIAKQPAMLSINTALQVDLYAQANASFVRGRTYSGFGGQPDFVSGALHSPGGNSVIALRSWHEKSNSSSIVPLLNEPTCSFQHSAIVTENGLAHIFGQSQREQAHLIIERAAHPDAREDLWRAAQSRGLGTID